MKITACHKHMKPGYQYGKHGMCYTYTRFNVNSRNNAIKKAMSDRDSAEERQVKAQKRFPIRWLFE